MASKQAEMNKVVTRLMAAGQPARCQSVFEHRLCGWVVNDNY